MQLSTNLSIKSSLAPYRAEFSDTVGYCVRGSTRFIFYCPDVDTWDRGWQTDQSLSPIDVIRSVNELPNRKMDEIPHPTVLQTLEKFKGLKTKITLIHLNHFNPLFNMQSQQCEQCRQAGMNFGVQGSTYEM